MKRLLTLFLVLWCSTAWAVEPINLARGFNPYVAGSAGGAAGAASCTSCNSGGDTLFASSATTYNSGDSWSAWQGWQFTTATTKCVSGVMAGAGDGGSSYGMTCMLYTDSSDSPGSIIAAGYTSTIADLPTNPDPYSEFLFATVQTLAAGTYWVVCNPGGNLVTWGRASSSSGTQKYSDDGSSWVSHSRATLFIMGVLGCDPS